MTFRFKEMPDSRATTAEPPTARLRFRALGTMDETFVQAYTLSATPAIYNTIWGSLFRKDIAVDPDGFNRWIVTVPYGRNEVQNGQWTWGYDTTGGSFHIKASKGTVARFPGSAPSYNQLIGVNDDNVEGADVVIPAMKINVSYKHPLGVLTLSYAYLIGSLTGMVNSAPMLLRPAGEVLFLGGTGSDGTQAEAEASYQFAVSPNLQGAVVGAISGIYKEGWDIAWIKWKNAVEGNRPVKHPEAVYVERVYQRIDLASALGFGG